MTEIATEATDDTAGWETDDEAPSDQAPPDTPSDQADDDSADAAARKQGVRERLANAEANLTAAREGLAQANALLYQLAAERAGVSVDLMAARGLQAEDFDNGSGVCNLDALADAMARERDGMGLPHKPRPNPVAGRTSNEGTKAASFGELLREAVRHS